MNFQLSIEDKNYNSPFLRESFLLPAGEGWVGDDFKPKKEMTGIMHAILLFAILLLMSCSIAGCSIYKKNTIYLNNEKLLKVNSIAVLPFYNLSTTMNADTIMANIILSEIVKTKKFHITKFGDIQDLLLNEKIASIPTIDIKTLHLIRRRFRVDAVLTGTIYKFDEPVEKGSDFTASIIDINICLLDTKSGKIICQGKLVDTGSTKGYLLDKTEIYPCFGLARRVAKRFIGDIMT